MAGVRGCSVAASIVCCAGIAEAMSSAEIGARMSASGCTVAICDSVSMDRFGSGTGAGGDATITTIGGGGGAGSCCAMTGDVLATS